VKPDPDLLSSVDQCIMEQERHSDIDNVTPTPPQAFSPKSLSRLIGGIEVIEADLACLENPRRRITGTIMDAYACLVPDKDNHLTKAGCIILSSLVPRLICGNILKCATLESVISAVSLFVQVGIYKLIFFFNHLDLDNQKQAMCTPVLGFSTVWRQSPSLDPGLG
jgi:hypothetical protein